MYSIPTKILITTHTIVSSIAGKTLLVPLTTSFISTQSAMASTIATMAMINAKCINTTKFPNPTKYPLLSFQNLPQGLASSTDEENKTKLSTSIAGTAIAGAIFSTLGSCEAAFAAQQIAEIAEGDNRGIALLLPIVPAIGWVLFNILQPALNQLNRMRSTRSGVIVGLGLGGLAASGFMSTPAASASEIASIAEAASDNRGTLLLFVVAPALLWVLYNILQPALNQLNRMRSQ